MMRRPIPYRSWRQQLRVDAHEVIVELNDVTILLGVTAFDLASDHPVSVPAR